MYLHVPEHTCVYLFYMSKNVKCAAWKLSLTSKLLTETEWHLSLSPLIWVSAPTDEVGGREMWRAATAASRSELYAPVTAHYVGRFESAGI